MKAPPVQRLRLDSIAFFFFENNLSKMFNIIVAIIRLIRIRTMCEEHSNDEAYKTRCDVYVNN